MSDIRVTYSGLISFAIGIASVFTGIIFTLIVTRSLSVDDFGTWGLIGGMVTYVIIIEPIISYWTTREIARGEETGKTAIFTSFLFSLGAALIYLVIAYFVGKSIGVDTKILFFAAGLIPLMFINRTLTAINLGWKPQSISYGILCFEIVKIPVALVFVYFMKLGIEGAITASIIAYGASNIILFYYGMKKIKGIFQIKFIKKWIKLSWISFYPGISSTIFHFDVIIFSTISGSIVGLAFYSAALTISNVVAHSKLISQGLYPKLLGGGKQQHLQENLTRFLYFGIPLTAMSFIFAKPALFALKPIYTLAVPVVIFLTIRAILYTLSQILNDATLGIEKVDMNEKSSHIDFIKSKLFTIPTMILIQYASYIITLLIGLLLFESSINDENNIDLVVLWSIIALATQIPFTIYFYIITRRYFTVAVKISVLVKYVISSIIAFGSTYLLMDYYLIYENAIFVFVPRLLGFALIGITIYVGITYIIDNRTRELFNLIINEIRK